MLLDRQNRHRGESQGGCAKAQDPSVGRRPVANGVPNSAEEVCRGWDVALSPGWRRCRRRLQKADDLWRGRAARHAVHRHVADDAVGIDDEHGRLRDAAPLAGVVDAPFPDDAAFRVAQNHERQPQVPPHCLGRLRRIDRHRHNISAAVPDFAVVVAVVRQLTEAEGSPVAAIEEERQRASGDQRRQALRRSWRVRQVEFRRNRSRHECLADRHGIILIDPGAGGNQKLSGAFVVHPAVRAGKVRPRRYPLRRSPSSWARSPGSSAWPRAASRQLEGA